MFKEPEDNSTSSSGDSAEESSSTKRTQPKAVNTRRKNWRNFTVNKSPTEKEILLYHHLSETSTELAAMDFLFYDVDADLYDLDMDSDRDFLVKGMAFI